MTLRLLPARHRATDATPQVRAVATAAITAAARSAADSRAVEARQANGSFKAVHGRGPEGDFGGRCGGGEEDVGGDRAGRRDDERLLRTGGGPGRPRGSARRGRIHLDSVSESASVLRL